MPSLIKFGISVHSTVPSKIIEKDEAIDSRFDQRVIFSICKLKQGRKCEHANDKDSVTKDLATTGVRTIAAKLTIRDSETYIVLEG